MGAEAARAAWRLPRGGRAVAQGWDSFSLGLGFAKDCGERNLNTTSSAAVR